MFDKVTGVFALLDESCMLKNSTDLVLVQKILNMHKNSDKILPPRINVANFTVTHTQSHVEYNANGFRTKNMDELSKEIAQVLLASANPLVRDIFLVDVSEEDHSALVSTTGTGAGNAFQTNANFSSSASTTSADQDSLKKGKGKEKTARFLGAKFRQQMKDLMAELNSSDVHFVRCIKVPWG